MKNPKLTFNQGLGKIRYKEWCNDGIHHRINGPAYIYNKKGNIEVVQWWINNIKIEPGFDFYPLNDEQIIEMKLRYG